MVFEERRMLRDVANIAVVVCDRAFFLKKEVDDP